MINKKRDKFLALSEEDLRIAERYLFLMNRFYDESRIAKELGNLNISKACFDRFKTYRAASNVVINEIMHNYNITNYDFSSLFLDDSVGGIYYNEA